MTNPWDIINSPIHYIPAPRPSMSLRILSILAVLALIAGGLWGVN